MEISTSTVINAPKAKVWEAITDIDGAKSTLSAIESIEILEKPANGLVGLKWRETRIMFGKKATETMWITEAEPLKYYQTRAENHGSVYISKLSVDGEDGHVKLTMGFEGHPQTFMAKVMSKLMSGLFKKATIKAIDTDLQDIKRSLEN